MKLLHLAGVGAMALFAGCAPQPAPPPQTPVPMTTAQLFPPPPGSVYSFSTARSGTCPNLEWHITLRDGSVLGGMISWDHERRMARVAGTLNQDRTFQMTATEVTGRGKATITGRVMDDGRMSARIVGAGCESRLIEVPLRSPLGPVGSG